MNTMRILVTENCNAKCPHCFNGAYREKKEIDIDVFCSLCEYLSKNHIDRLKIMGGEPTIHSAFEELVSIAQSYFVSVVIFTNAINERILNIKPRVNDTIVYNFNFISSRFDCNKFLFSLPGRRRLEVQISSKTNIDNVINRLFLFRDYPNLQINLTLDCMEDIFNKKQILEQKLNALSIFITRELNKSFFIDHKIPICFFGTNAHSHKSFCSLDCAGLIDSSLRLRYCNQYELPLCNILDKDGNYISFENVKSELEKGYNLKLDYLADNKCKDCSYFPHMCNGGCFAHKMRY